MSAVAGKHKLTNVLQVDKSKSKENFENMLALNPFAFGLVEQGIYFGELKLPNDVFKGFE